MKKLLLLIGIPLIVAYGLTRVGVTVDSSLIKFGSFQITPELPELAPEDELRAQLLSHLNWEEGAEPQLIVINRWATWCGPCIREIPDLNQLAADFANSPVIFVAVSDEEEEVVSNWFESRENFNFDYQLISGDTDLIELLNTYDRVQGGRVIPYHLVLTSDFELLGSWSGARIENIRRIRNILKERL